MAHRCQICNTVKKNPPPPFKIDSPPFDFGQGHPWSIFTCPSISQPLWDTASPIQGQPIVVRCKMTGLILIRTPILLRPSRHPIRSGWLNYQRAWDECHIQTEVWTFARNTIIIYALRINRHDLPLCGAQSRINRSDPLQPSQEGDDSHTSAE